MSVQGLTAFGLTDNSTAAAGRLTQLQIQPIPAENLLYLSESTTQGADQGRQPHDRQTGPGGKYTHSDAVPARSCSSPPDGGVRASPVGAERDDESIRAGDDNTRDRLPTTDYRSASNDAVTSAPWCAAFRLGSSAPPDTTAQAVAPPHCLNDRHRRSYP